MTQSAALFSGPAPRVRTAPAGTDATALLARALRDELHAPADPFRPADPIVLLPNRRSVGALINAFHATGAPTLLPAIRPLGDLDDAPEVWGAGGLDLDVAPAIDPLRRRLELARLVAARDRAEGGVDDPLQALACADDLCRLLDSAAAGVSGARVVEIGAIMQSDLNEDVLARISKLELGAASEVFDLGGQPATLVLCQRDTVAEELPSMQEVEDGLVESELSLIAQRYLRNLRQDSTILTP